MRGLRYGVAALIGLLGVATAFALTPTEGAGEKGVRQLALSDKVADEVDPAGLSFTPPDAPTADHTKFEQLRKDFQTGPEVTAACLGCHTEAAKQLMKTSHWTWICPGAKKQLEEREHIAVGKAEHVVNNFCIALPSNEPRCTSCHAGYGWKDKSFDFQNETLVDCLICHDQTGKYKKFPTAAGHPVYAKDFPEGRKFGKKTWKPVDLQAVAQQVGRPTRDNCGTCHFFGGGGEGVKHGDMDVTLSKPSRSLDVHMAVDGPDFDCMMCHTTHAHKVAGRCFVNPAYEKREYKLRGLEENLLACESCHGAKPHKESRDKLNDHSNKVSCEACHIPRMAREKATKMWWDWSQAGRKTADGKLIVEKDPKLKEMTYHTKKGSFVWAKDVEPEYMWFAGKMEHSFLGDKIDDSMPQGDENAKRKGLYDKIDTKKPIVAINSIDAGYDDPDARIWPVKVHRGIQPYDTVNKTLVVPHLFPFHKKDKTAYWKGYDWATSIQAGMDYVAEKNPDLKYSGEFGWIQTEMIWPLKHMVAPKEDAVSCNECHAPEGRLAKLDGFYMPGRDRHAGLDTVGLILVALTILATLIHGLMRVVMRRKGAAQ